VVCAADGLAALDQLAQRPFQVLITDWEMPRMDGIALCQAVRRGSSLSGVDGGYVYVILLTSHGTVAERVRGLSAGADDFITKPFEPQELLARMQAAERLLSLRRATSRSSPWPSSPRAATSRRARTSSG